MTAVKINIERTKKKRTTRNKQEPMYKSSKRIALLIFSSLYSIVVLSNLFAGKKIDDNILTSLEIIIGACIGSITASHIFKK